jgi:hypothetical protein
MTETFASKIYALAVAGPVVVATLGVIAFSGQELRGEAPFSYGPVRNVAEAAAMGHASEVLRLLAAGQDPNQVWPVRRDIISSTITKVTALEAAVWSRRVQLVELLDRQGVIDDRSRRHLACLANDLENPVEDIVLYLSPDGPLNCAHGQAIAAVLERSGGL